MIVPVHAPGIGGSLADHFNPLVQKIESPNTAGQ